MRKSLLLVLMMLSFAPLGLRAQNSLFDFESDTICVGQKLHIEPHAMNASTYYWGFCSGYLNATPILDNMGSTFQFNAPSAIEIGKDADKNYYGFVVNPVGELLRLSFGKSLISIPTVTNFGTLDDAVTPSPNSLYLTQDNGNWFLFMVGGGAQPSSLSRIDFGKNLGNVPNGVRMGNPGGLLLDPRGIFVAKQGNVYYGFVVNNGNNRLIRLNFGNNISRTPTATQITPITSGFGGGGISGPTDMVGVFDQGLWYFFVTNVGAGGPGGGATVSRLFFGNQLSNTPVLTTAVAAGGGMGNPTRLRGPSGISIVRDCGGYYAYITNRNNDSVLRYNVSNLSTAFVFNKAYIGAGLDQPSDLTRVVRDRDSLFMFVVNAGNNALTRILFPQCQNASIQSSDLPKPPSPSYDNQGVFNVYLAINEGLPNAAIDCKQVTVIRVPPINLSNDTLICQGDTLHVIAGSQYALNYYFSPNYNISDTAGINIKVYPKISTTYHIRIPFPEGCVVDTTLRVDVSRVKADAGPDRAISDGASTVLGGPETYKGKPYTYTWFPTDFMDNPFTLNPTVKPIRDIAYYLRITNTDGCSDIDTVKVTVSCNGFNVPNAFAPDNGRGAPKTFGLLNAEKLVLLNYFRIFDRWGKEVFSTSDRTKQWDGMVNGNPAPFGVYVWEADGFCESHERLTRSGNVTLFR